jgi:hypothetical protein
MENTCPKVEKCPIFVNNVLTIENAVVAYKSLYCQAGEPKFKTCKRFIVSNKVGSCPPDVLPNCSRTIDEIIERVTVT